MPRVEELATRWVEELPATGSGWAVRSREREWLDEAVWTCRELGPGQPNLLLHGDLVFDNVLRAEREPWLAIDPDGLVGEPAFDAAQFLTNRWSELSVTDTVKTVLAHF